MTIPGKSRSPEDEDRLKQLLSLIQITPDQSGGFWPSTWRLSKSQASELVESFEQEPEAFTSSTVERGRKGQSQKQSRAFALLEYLCSADKLDGEPISEKQNSPNADQSESDDPESLSFYCRLLEDLIWHVPEVIEEEGYAYSGNVLHAACSLGTRSAAEVILRLLGPGQQPFYGDLLARRDARNPRPTSLAIRSNDIALLELLASHDEGLRVESVYHAAVNGSVPQLEVLLRNRKGMMDDRLRPGIYIGAAESDNWREVWDFLDRQGGDPSIWDQVLRAAVERRDLKAVRCVLETRPEVLESQEELVRTITIAVGLSKGQDIGTHGARSPRPAEKDRQVSVAIERTILYYMMKHMDSTEVKAYWSLEEGQWTAKEVDLDLDMQNPLSWTWFCQMVKTAEQEVKAWRENRLAAAAEPLAKQTAGTETMPSRYNVGFQPCLKSVTIPNLDQFRAHECAAGIRHLFGSEAKYILQWLRLVKGVRKVLQLRVTDSRLTPHSEETIEEAIEGLGVEELDWRRLDLSTRTVRDAAKTAHTLHLYASGSWTPIYSWVSQPGLGLLSETAVRNLVITITKDPDSGVSQTRVQEQTKLIRDALQENGWEPGDEAEGQGKRTFDVRALPWTATAPPGIINEPAIETRDPRGIIRLSKFIPRYQRVHRKEGARPINIAILDSGIDGSEFPPDLDLAGASFCGTHWWLAPDPHGTQMAKIITAIDPCCRLRIAKVADHCTSITIEAVVRALNHAITTQADIISMSFALHSTSPKLQAAIAAAHRAGIVLLCSTADEGDNRTRAWPASCDGAIAIAACDDSGGKLGSSASGAGYFFRGVDVEVLRGLPGGDDGSGGGKEGVESISGSSVATAIAAGVAALCLACCEIDGVEVSPQNRRRKVVELFDRAKEGKYMRPWTLFGEARRGDNEPMFLSVP